MVKEIFKKEKKGFVKLGERWEKRAKDMSKKIISNQSAFINLYSEKVKKMVEKKGEKLKKT